MDGGKDSDQLTGEIVEQNDRPRNQVSRGYRRRELIDRWSPNQAVND